MYITSIIPKLPNEVVIFLVLESEKLSFREAKCLGLADCAYICLDQ